MSTTEIQKVDREKAAALWEAMQAANLALQNAEEGIDQDKAIDDKFEKLEDEMRVRHIKERTELNAQRQAAYGIGELQAKASAAERAYSDPSVPAVLTNWNDEEIIRCAKSNKPVLEDDEIIKDEVADQVFLRSELGLPPRPEEKDEDDLEDAA